LNLPGDGTPFEVTVRESDGVLVACAANNARTALEAGITTLRECGGRGMTTFDVRRALELGYGVGPRLVLSGSPITITGGHCWYFGAEADGVDGVRRMAREMAKRGADWIKVMGTGGGTLNTISHLPSYSVEEIAAVTEQAHALDRPIGIHCLCAGSIRYAVQAGADQIEHCSFIADAAGRQEYDPEVAAQVAAAGILVTTTLAVGHYVVRCLERKETLTPEEQASLDLWRIMAADNIRQFRQMLAAGVKFVAGTDAGWRFTPFDSLPVELDLMRQAGMSSMEAIVAATGRAAQACRIADQTGTLRPGLAADIIAVPGNPLDDLSVLQHPELVLQDGQIRLSRVHQAMPIAL
jgi:imidazolonepropionase-like amidohydrolase